MTIDTGKILNNRYRIVKLLGQGGFGAVYRAWDINLKGVCAVKENFDTSPAAQEQFEREASILYHLRHPNLPRVTDYFSIPGQGQYLVMDFVEGEDLQVQMERQPGGLPPDQVIEWVGQICDALDYLHNQKPPVIHRDIKPANIRVSSQGQAMLVDFGIAKIFDAASKTTLGARAVTPGYSPFEQYGQGKTDARSDLYALAACTYALLTGAQPPESLQRVLNDPLQPPRQINPRISPALEAALMKGMAMDPSARFQRAGEFKAALAGASRPVELPGPAPAPSKPLQATVAAERPPSAPLFANGRGAQLHVDPAGLAPAVPTGASARPAASPRRSAFPWRPVLAGSLLLVILLAVVFILRRNGSSETPNSSASSEEFQAYIKDTWGSGYDLTGLVYGSENWLALFSMGEENLEQKYKTDPQVNDEFIRQSWAEGFDLTSLAYGKGGWVTVLSRGKQNLKQAYQSSPTFPEEFIRQEWDQGFDISTAAYGDGNWYVVCSQYPQNLRQTYKLSAEFPEDYIQDQWSQGFDITTLAYGGGQWLVVVSQGGENLSQVFKLDPALPEDFIRENWSSGFDLTQVAYGDGTWAVVLSKGSRNLKQQYKMSAAAP